MGEEKQSRIPDQTIAFVERVFAKGLDATLDDRDRFFIAHRITKRHLTLQELAPFGDVQTAATANKLWRRRIQDLWNNSTPEEQQRYPLAEILPRIGGVKPGIKKSLEHRKRLSEGITGHKQSSGHIARRSKAMEGKNEGKNLGKKHTEETKAKVAAARRGKKHSAVTRENMSKKQLERWVPKERLEQAEEFTLYQKPPQP